MQKLIREKKDIKRSRAFLMCKIDYGKETWQNFKAMCSVETWIRKRKVA